MVFFHTAGPNTALVKSTGEITISGRVFVIPILQRVDKLSLNLRTISVRTERGTTVNGVGVDVSSCCQVKVRAWIPPGDPQHENPSKKKNIERLGLDINAVKLAAQHFIGRTEDEINETISKTVAGHQRAIIGSLTVEQLYRDRLAFSKRVWEQCTEDMRSMGLVIVSYTVADISDDNGYIEALGVRQTEKVKREAEEGAALHREGARSKKAQAEAVAYTLVNKEREKKIKSDQHRKVKQAAAEKELDRARAVQEKAYGIAEAEQNAILLVERQKATAAEIEAERKVAAFRVEREKLIKAETINVAADAQLYKRKVEAERTVVLAKARTERERSIAEAEAYATREKGKAENERFKARMKVWKECGNEAAILEKFVEMLPDVASAIAEPLGQTEKMVFVNSSGDERGARKESGDVEMPETASGLGSMNIRSVVAAIVKSEEAKDVQ